jgi:hypothetical protein
MQIGKNQQCLCGSGEKFRRCHGARLGMGADLRAPASLAAHAAADTPASAQTIRSASEQILNICSLLEEAVRRFLAVARTIPVHTVFEADDEAHLMTLLIVRYTESVVEMARRDLVLAPAALVVARAALETSARAIWLLQPEKPFQREQRWLVLVREQVDYIMRRADRLERKGRDISSLRESERSMSEFADSLEDKLSKKLPGYVRLQRIPKFDKMLDMLGLGDAYLVYMQMSQFAHGSQVATATYRKGLGIGKIIEETASDDQWAISLSMIWLSLREASSLFLARFYVSPSDVWPDVFVGSLSGSLSSLLSPPRR